MGNKYIRLIILTVVLLTLMLPSVTLAANPIVNITFSANVSTGITGFTITYVNDRQLDMTWGYNLDAVAIMIRAKYGTSPNDITSTNETPSDGYLVYAGNLTSASDTSMDFDSNPGPIYYKAWGQKADGTWYIQTNTGEKESLVMTILGIIAFAGILSYISLKNRDNILLALGATIAWIYLFAYTRNNPISGVTLGSNVDNMMILAILAIAIAIPIVAIKNIRTNKKLQDKGFVLGGNGSLVKDDNYTRKQSPIMDSSTMEYRAMIRNRMKRRK